MLVVVVVVTVVLTLLGLGILSLGALESAMALDALRTRQAAWGAEAGLRAVKHWFDAPAGSVGAWMVPAPSEVDRSRRRLDPDGTGSYRPWSSLPAPWNVQYRQGRDDLFERPYRGGPLFELSGDETGPDILIVPEGMAGASGEFLARLSRSLFGEGPSPPLVLELARIAIHAPPTIGEASARRRIGIASIEVTARLVRRGGGEERVLSTARAAGVLQDLPYAVPGPLIAGVLADGTGLDARWGTVLVSGAAHLGADPASFYGGGWPWLIPARRLVADRDGDGTAEDSDADGTPDLEEWLALPDAGLADPWFRLVAGGALFGAPRSDPQPYPFDAALIPGSWTTADDRSGLFQGTDLAGAAVGGPAATAASSRMMQLALAAPAFSWGMPSGSGAAARVILLDRGAAASLALAAGLLQTEGASPAAIAMLREAAADGGGAGHLLRYVAGTDPPLFREGEGLPVSFEEATRGGEGLFYFDTADALAPRDLDGDGAPDNLTPPIAVTNRDWFARGCIVVNARAFGLGPSSRAGTGAIEPPGEPFDDADADGAWDAEETFLRLGYPADPLAPGARFTRLGAASALSGGSRRVAGPGVSAPLSFEGLLIATGDWTGESDARIHGALVVRGALRAPSSSGARAMQLLYDHRLGDDAWPPPGSTLVRTVWQGRFVTP